MRYFFYFLMILLTFSSCQTKKKEVWVFIMAGQSNMAGRAIIEEEDEIEHERVFVINEEGEKVFAKEPLHFYEPQLVGLDCGLSFGKELVYNLPKNVSILLVPTAVGSSSISQWINDETFREVTLYSNLLEQSTIAQNYGEVKGILWHQGETDATNQEDIELYKERLGVLFTKFRNDLNNENLPIFIGGLGSFSENNEAWQAINTQINYYIKEDSNAYFISTSDLHHKGDFIHFDSEGQRKMGKRFAQAFLQQMK